MYIIWYIAIGLLAGYAAAKIMRGRGYGLFVNLIIGIIGSVLGGWLFALFGVVYIGFVGSLITSVVGAILLLWIASLLRPRSRE